MYSQEIASVHKTLIVAMGIDVSLVVIGWPRGSVAVNQGDAGAFVCVDISLEHEV